MSGTSCTFNQGGTSVAIFCENGCCATDCCTDPTMDDDALAIALAIIIGFLLLLALIAIIMYCCLRRKKKKKNGSKENKNKNKNKNRNEVVPLSTISSNSSNSNAGHSLSKHSQTGDPHPQGKDKILWGRSPRWSAEPTSKSRSQPRKAPWNRSKKKTEKSTQTVAGDHAPAKHAVPEDGRIPLQHSPNYLDDDNHTSEKGVQTPGPRTTMTRAKTKPVLPSDTATVAPKRPWRFSMQHKSLTTIGPPGLDTELNYTTEHQDPGYPVHRHPPDFAYDSDISRSQSIPPPTDRTHNSEV